MNINLFNIKKYMFLVFTFIFLFLNIFIFAEEGESVSRIGLFPFQNESHDSQYDSLCSTMGDTLLLNFNIMNRYTVEQDMTFNPFLDDTETERYFNFSKYDYAIYGRIFKDEENILTFEVIAYDRAHQENIISRQEKISNVFYIFDASDLLMEEVIDTFSIQHLGFGALNLENLGELGRYQVLINGQSAGWNILEFPKLLVGTHQIIIRQDRMLGEEILLDQLISNREEETTVLSFSIPYLTETEAKELVEREQFIKAKWNVQREEMAIEETFQELFNLMDDVSYCDRLTRKVNEYEMWKDIYDDQGEIPGVKKGARLSHNYFSIEPGYSYGMPVGQSAIFVNPFHEITLALSYSFNQAWGILGLGIKAGFSNQSTKETEDIMYPFQMISAPLGGFLSYTTHFNSPFFATAGLTSGVTVNSIEYNQLSTARSDGSMTAIYLEPFVGGGFYFIRNFGTKLIFKSRMIFFEDITYTSIAPGIELFIHL